MDCGVHLLEILYESMNNEEYTADMFAPAIYVAFEYLNDIEQSLKRLKSAAIALPEREGGPRSGG